MLCHFSCERMPIHWLVYGHMTSNNASVYHQMPLAGNLAKTMTSNSNNSLLPEKCWLLLHMFRACSWTWPDVVAEISAWFWFLFCSVVTPGTKDVVVWSIHFFLFIWSPLLILMNNYSCQETKQIWYCLNLNCLLN